AVCGIAASFAAMACAAMLACNDHAVFVVIAHGPHCHHRADPVCGGAGAGAAIRYDRARRPHSDSAAFARWLGRRPPPPPQPPPPRAGRGAARRRGGGPPPTPRPPPPPPPRNPPPPPPRIPPPPPPQRRRPLPLMRRPPHRRRRRARGTSTCANRSAS